MESEYSAIDSNGNQCALYDFSFESGAVMERIELCYQTYGCLNEARDNAIIVCHWLTGNASVEQWWGKLLGPRKALDTERDFIICANTLGSCYGSSGTASLNPATSEVYGTSFPQVTIRDAVRAQVRLVREHLGVRGVKCVLGGSMGGMLALEWVLITAEEESANSSQHSQSGYRYVRSAVIIGCSARQGAWQIAHSELQRQAIYNDPHWDGGNFLTRRLDAPAPEAGLSLARQMAMVSYRSAQGYETKFGRQVHAPSGQWQAQRYLQHQGEKFVRRMDALTYVRLTQCMDTHDVCRGRAGPDVGAEQDNHNASTADVSENSSAPACASVDGTQQQQQQQQVLSAVRCPVLVLGLDSDALYPLHQVQELSRNLPRAQWRLIRTAHGHDGFLLEQDQVNEAVRTFLDGVV